MGVKRQKDNPSIKTALIHCMTFSCILLIVALLFVPMPAQSQDPAPQRIESDDPAVTRVGNWTSQATTQASSSSYLYSSGAETDVLTLQFSGPSIEVIFVAGPSLGTLATQLNPTGKADSKAAQLAPFCFLPKLIYNKH